MEAVHYIEMTCYVWSAMKFRDDIHFERDMQCRNLPRSDACGLNRVLRILDECVCKDDSRVMTLLERRLIDHHDRKKERGKESV